MRFYRITKMEVFIKTCLVTENLIGSFYVFYFLFISVFMCIFVLFSFYRQTNKIEMEHLSWQDFLDKLVQQQGKTNLKDFGKISEDKEKVSFCLKDTKIGNELDKWLDNNPSHANEKDSNVYSKSKADGNTAYVKKDNQNAIELYNNALLHAHQGLESAFIFGNRSAVLFSEGRYEESILDINLAINNAFPLPKASKLYKRKAEALVKLNRSREAKQCLEEAISSLQQIENTEIEIGKLSELLDELDLSKESSVESNIDEIGILPLYGGQNPKITCASSFITKCFDEERGRYIIANQDIPKGSVVISEPPYAAVLLKPWYLTHCQHCFQKVGLLISCHQCAEVCFCSEECRRVSFEQYHYFECGKLDLLEKLGISRLAVRIILTTPLETLRQFQDESKPTIEALESGCDESGVYRVDYVSVYHLLTNSDSMLAEDVFQYSCAAAVLLKCLQRQSSLIENSDLPFVGGLLLRHIQQLVCNAHAITALSVTAGDQSSVVEESQVRIATAIYPTTSLLNHSCQPSIVNTFQKNHLVVKLACDIKKGEEIFNCYGPHYRRMSFEERQRALEQQYFFKCKCCHCIRGATSVNEYNCFSCTQCERNLKGEGRCSICNAHQGERIKYCQNVQQACNDMFQKALSLISYFELATNNNNGDKDVSDSVKAALKLLERCLESRSSILFKQHKDLGETHDAIGKCYAILGDYEASVAHVTQSIAIVELHFGEDSLEVTNELLKLSDVYMAWVQQLIDSKNKGKIRETLETIGIPSVKRALNLVKLNKSCDDGDIKLLKERLSSLDKLKFLCQSS